MVKNLQKTAAFYRKNVGVIDPEGFAKHVQMEIYEPSAELAPFVSHYFVARFNVGEAGYEASDVLSEPDVHVVFAPHESFIMGVMTARRAIALKGKGCYAGIRFKSGGFHGFWPGAMADLAERTVPVSDIFPAADEAFAKRVLTLDDPSIIAAFETLLKTRNPKTDPKIDLIDRIIDTIETTPALTTTSAVARQFAVSERSLQVLFQTYTGIGVKWVIMRLRLLEAIRHAHNPSSLNWTTVAAELGYSTQSHFVNDFKKVIGISPTKYIRLHLTKS
jgi:AraC-like DNA-binding protein